MERKKVVAATPANCFTCCCFGILSFWPVANFLTINWESIFAAPALVVVLENVGLVALGISCQLVNFLLTGRLLEEGKFYYHHYHCYYFYFYFDPFPK